MAESREAGERKVRIVADHRESNNHVFSSLAGMGAELVREQLKTADFICSDRVAIERKTVVDFIQSVIDQRIFRQASEISECFENPILIIEGDSDMLFSERNLHPNAIRGALASLAIDYRIPIIWTSGPAETANQIYWMAYREQIRESRTPSIRCPRRCKSPREEQEFLVAGLPNINTKLSRSLLGKFKTPKRVFSASQEKLMKVEGIGRLKSRRIWELLNTEHREDADG